MRNCNYPDYIHSLGIDQAIGKLVQLQRSVISKSGVLADPWILGQPAPSIIERRNKIATETFLLPFVVLDRF